MVSATLSSSSQHSFLSSLPTYVLTYQDKHFSLLISQWTQQIDRRHSYVTHRFYLHEHALLFLRPWISYLNYFYCLLTINLYLKIIYNYMQIRKKPAISQYLILIGWCYTTFNKTVLPFPFFLVWIPILILVLSLSGHIDSKAETNSCPGIALQLL